MGLQQIKFRENFLLPPLPRQAILHWPRHFSSFLSQCDRGVYVCTFLNREKIRNAIPSIVGDKAGN